MDNIRSKHQLFSFPKCYRHLLIGLLLLVGAVTLLINGANLIRLIGPVVQSSAQFHFACSAKAVALTIDDSPDEKTTPQILEALAENQVNATFFVIGDRGAKYPNLLTRMHREGHELANHTKEESTTALLREPKLTESIQFTDKILSPYQSVNWFRPGTGLYNQKILDAIAPFNYRIALGDVFPLDTIIPFSRFHSWYVARSVKPGSIIVMHDAKQRGQHTAQSLNLFLPKLKAKGYQVMPLQQLAQHPQCSTNTL